MTWELVWILWVGLFIILELKAIVERQGGTLSEQVWRWTSGSLVKRLILLLFLVWLTLHFVWEL